MLLNMKLPIGVTRGWERCFPDLFGKWTHWKIIGDDYFIALIDGTKLAEAKRIIEDNYGEYSSIKACRAIVDENGNLLEEEGKSLYEISNYRNDETLRKRLEAKYA